MIQVRVRQKPGRYLQLYYVDPLTGRDVTRSTKTIDKKQAERLAAAWEAELAALGPSSGPVPWHVFRSKFEQQHLIHVSILTRRSYTTALNSFEKHIGKPRSVDLITTATMTEFSTALMRAKLARHTVAKNLRHVKAALSWACEQGMIQRAPKVKLPKLAGQGMKGRPLTLWEVIALLRAAKQVRPDDYKELRKAIKLIWLSGLRLNEAVRLSWDRPPVRLDFRGKFPQIIFDGRGQKSGVSESVPLTPDCAKFLGRIKQPKGPVLKCVTRLERLISECGEQAEIVVNESGKFASAHDLRRSFGTRWAMRVLPQVLKVLMRHADIKTTLEYYVGLRADDIASVLYSVPPTVPPGTALGSQNQKRT